MKVAFTLDDLPIWPMSYPPEGYSVDGIVASIIAALDRHRITGVYGFANSWALVKHPDTAAILDVWVDAGHHIGNHTHGHIEFNETPLETYLGDIAECERQIERWLAKAPVRYFRHPLCYWGNTDEKRVAARRFLADRNYVTAEVTSWSYEWRWNRAYRQSLAAGDANTVQFLKSSFLDFAVAQLRYDVDCANRWFGHRVIPITLGHTVPFFADMADQFFTRLLAEGVEFVSLDEACRDPAYDDIASVTTDRFLVYQQKLAVAAGSPMSMIVPEQQGVFDHVTELQNGLSW